MDTSEGAPGGGVRDIFVPGRVRDKVPRVSAQCGMHTYAYLHLLSGARRGCSVYMRCRGASRARNYVIGETWKTLRVVHRSRWVIVASDPHLHFDGLVLGRLV